MAVAEVRWAGVRWASLCDRKMVKKRMRGCLRAATLHPLGDRVPGEDLLSCGARSGLFGGFWPGAARQWMRDAGAFGEEKIGVRVEMQEE